MHPNATRRVYKEESFSSLICLLKNFVSQCTTLGEDFNRVKGAVATLSGANRVREDGVTIHIKQQYDQYGCVLLCSRSDVDDVCSGGS